MGSHVPPAFSRTTRTEMNSQFRFFTDTATLAVFDPERLKHRAGAESDWWCLDFLQLEEFRSGTFAVIALGGDGVYRMRITTGDLTLDERDYAVGAVRGLGVEVVSGKVFVGAAECMPGGGIAFTSADVDRGLLLDTENGRYEVDLFAIQWFNSPRWWRDDRSVPDGAPVDIVAVLKPRLTPFAEICSQSRLDFYSSAYLFESTTRRVGPEPGMILTTKVRRGPSGELCLKECGPRSYRASLVDYSGVAWKDTIRLRVISVDHHSKQLVGEFVEKAIGQ
jgi:Family of unknown function (DUF6386)